MSSAARLLQNALRSMLSISLCRHALSRTHVLHRSVAMHKDPVEGVAVELVDDSNIFEWTIYIEGPKDTP
jgi:hypothetical protein